MTPDLHQKSTTELLEQFREDNLRLIRENLRLRNQRRKLKNAFRRYVDTHFIQCRASKHRESRNGK